MDSYYSRGRGKTSVTAYKAVEARIRHLPLLRKNPDSSPLSPANTKSEDEKPLDYIAPVLIEFQAFFARAPQMETNGFEFIKNFKCPSVTFIPEICKIAEITESEKVELPKLAKLITAQSNNTDFRIAFTSVRRPSTLFCVDSDGVLVLLLV